jgi:ATP-dependent DNA helicase UvrD/PcrA
MIGDTVVRGRIDAVFGDGNGGFTVVDWKTGEPPVSSVDMEHNAIQLAVYRLAWAAMQGVPVESVGAAFHYVRSGRTVVPDVLPDAEELAALLGKETPTSARCGTP